MAFKNLLLNLKTGYITFLVTVSLNKRFVLEKVISVKVCAVSVVSGSLPRDPFYWHFSTQQHY